METALAWPAWPATAPGSDTLYSQPAATTGENARADKKNGSADSFLESQVRIIMDDPDWDAESDSMEFRLTYDGLLLGASRSDTRAQHKHEIRKALHPQIKRLWQIVPQLSGMRVPPIGLIEVNYWQKHSLSRIDSLADRFCNIGYNFVPLITSDLEVSFCGIEILMLRTDPPGALIQSGDIDNRLKTIFDALRMPVDKNELGGYDTPEPSEQPFFCLLQDDKLITKVTVETDLLLQGVHDPIDLNDVRLVIKVIIQPRLARLDLSEITYNFGGARPQQKE